MSPQLQRSIQHAQKVLDKKGQEQLAAIIELFTVQHEQQTNDVFSLEEIESIRQQCEQPFVEADARKVDALFAKHAL